MHLTLPAYLSLRRVGKNKMKPAGLAAQNSSKSGGVVEFPILQRPSAKFPAGSSAAPASSVLLSVRTAGPTVGMHSRPQAASGN